MARLTEEMIIARSKQSDLTAIKKLNCWCVIQRKSSATMIHPASLQRDDEIPLLIRSLCPS